MSSSNKVCPQCGLPVEIGLANCKYCGGQIGTLFSPDAPPLPSPKANAHQRLRSDINHFQQIEKAQERSNTAVIFGLISFFCVGIGFLTSLIAIYFGFSSRRTLKDYHIEEGQGSALAGLIIGILALVAQICYVIYIVKIGIPF